VTQFINRSPDYFDFLGSYYSLLRKFTVKTIIYRGFQTKIQGRITVETIKLFLTKFTDETITISSMSLLFVTSILIIYWVYNRKKFHKLTHQIPASVVKNYLDSIIQNSTSLKSSLFRGGGMDLGGGIPSVMPVSTLPTGGASGDGASSEELNQKMAEIAALQAQLAQKNQVIADLEAQLAAGGGGDGEDVSKYQEEIAELEEQLAAAQASGDGGAGEIKRDLEKVTSERDEFKDRLLEYEIIEEDLANLKRLQQENEQLKKSLAEAGGSVPEAVDEPVAEEPVEVAEEPVAEEPVEVAEEPAEEVVAAAEEPAAEEPAEEVVAAAEEPAAEEPAEEVVAAAEEPAAEPAEETPMPKADGGEQKSAEELLSEFEKMLG